MEAILITLAVVAITELIKRIQAKDNQGALKIVVAVVVGGLAGWVGLEGLTIVTGIESGLAAAGAFKLTTNFKTS